MIAKPASDRLQSLRATQDALVKLGGQYAALRLVAIAVNASQLDRSTAWDNANSRATKGVIGWSRHQSGCLRSGGPPVRDSVSDEIGPALLGEWALDSSTSVHLRSDTSHPDQFIEWTYSERDLSGTELSGPEEIPALCEVVHVLSNSAEQEGKHEVFVYHTFWGAEDEGNPFSLRRLCSRFAGVERVDLAWRRKRGS